MSTGSVSKVVDYKFKSYSNYTGPDDPFERANIFFASNGQGKSALALGIRDEYLKTNSEDGLRIYNKDYVETKLRTSESSGNIRGVKLNFGKNAGIEEQLATLEEERVKITEDADKIKEDNDKLIRTTEDTITDIFTRRKGKSKIKTKNHKDGVHEKVVGLWIDEYNEALKLFPKEDYKVISGEDDFSKNLDAITNVALPSISLLTDDDYSEIKRILEKPYNTSAIPTPEVVKWLETGVELHHGKQACEFCLNMVNLAEIAERVTKYSKDEQSTDSKKIEKNIADINDIVTKARDLVDGRLATLLILDNHPDAIACFDDIENQLEYIEGHLTVLSEKLADMGSEKVDMSGDLRGELDIINRNIDDLKQVKSELKTDYENRINRLETLVKGGIGYEIKNNEVINSNVKTYTDNVKKLKALRKKYSEKTTAINDLKDSKSDLADFARYLNEVLTDINIGFKLRLDTTDKSYFIENVATQEKLHIKDISEGECNFLALIYFYYEMLSDDGETLRDDINVVIIDDPISSLDDENRFYILELVKKVIDDKKFQSFIFTHAWHDFYDLCYGKNEDQHVKKYEIRKSDNNSRVYTATSIINPYKKLFKEVFDFSQKKLEDLEPDEILHIPNTMRRVLEEYMRFNHGVEFATQANYNKIARVLMQEEVAKISTKNETRIRTLLSVCNVLSHGTPRTQSTSDIHNSAKFLMTRFRAVDQYHYDEMRS